MSAFERARLAFAATVASMMMAMNSEAPRVMRSAGKYMGPFRPLRQSRSGRVAWDKRIARKRRGVLQHKMACA